MQLSVPFILASGSPRRSHLLAATDFQFEVIPADMKEIVIEGEPADQMVSRLSKENGSLISDQYSSSLVLAADTCVVLDDHILGKPTSFDDAVLMLKRLRNRRHIVHTGIALLHKDSGRTVTKGETTHVDFAPVSDDEIHEYVKGGSPMDKAGGYGIQDDRGAFFVRGIEGDFYNVMGLPLHRLYVTLRSDFKDLITG